MSEVLLSVIIPTKNRYSALIPTLKAICKSIIDERIEFVIQDNSTNNAEILEYLNCNIDKRINYFYLQEDIGAVTNFNIAIDHAIGKYLIIIGDDDLINPYIMKILDIVVESDIDCLIYPRANYYWSNVIFTKKFDYFEPSSLQVIIDPDLEIEQLSSAEELKYVLSLGGIYLYRLPALYHGIVKKEIVDRIVKKHGSYVLGPSPDMSLAISLAFELDYYHYINFPVSIAGASYNSAAGMGRRGAHSASLENLPDCVSKDIAFNWDPNIPRVWNGFTVYAQSIYMVCKYYKMNFSVDYLKMYDKILKDNIKDLVFLKELTEFRKFGWFKVNYIVVKNIIVNFTKIIVLLLPRVILDRLIKQHNYFSKLKHVKGIHSVEKCIGWLMIEYRNIF